MIRRLAVAVVVALLPIVAMSAPAQADTQLDEMAFVRDINALRATKGLSPLVADARLTDVARNFAVKMAASGGIYHNPDLASQAPGDWLKLGENVGVGGDEPGLHQAFVNSPGHYRNLVDGDFQSVGIGVVYSGGRMWVVEEFMKSENPPVPLVVTKPAPVTSSDARLNRYRQVLANRG